ncbi:MAG: hypothetical protein HOC60_01165 [Rhodospirillaceae bacterium]|nr:hypothetical protein [Rhodospirillaceae bacterium]
MAAPAPTPAPARMHSPQPNVRKHPHTQRTHPQQAAQMMQHRSQGHHKSHKNKSSNHHASAPAIDDAVKTKWVAARTAFWRRDLAGAEKLYKELLEASKEADIAGELGNIYLMQRRPKEATDMYFEAANRLLGGEHPMHARKVISTLRRLDPEKAEQVRQKIREHHKTEHGGHTEPAQIKENTK